MPSRRRISIPHPLSISLAVAVLVALAACSRDRTPAGTPPHTSIVAAGDIAGCWWRSDESTARLLDHISGVVAPLGDNVYQAGTRAQYRDCYAPTWGRHRARTRPAIGNHDMRTEEGAAYYEFFGAAAGPRGKGWYSYDLEGWHVVVLNSEVGIDSTSEQVGWLRADLAAHPVKCTLAYMHRPRFSSGEHGDSERMKPAFRALYDGGVDVVLGGHDHVYERFAPQDPAGRKDRNRGVRQFVVGTGGAPFYDFHEKLDDNSEVHQNRVHGVLRLVFHPDGYDWEFVGVNDDFEDHGHGDCH
ncbi:metallophosphoesterase family protein [Longimicrobium sp.]|uniref:metallophosphoesterase family protein n=1 Tax=Longimicrobium sp. TaxID=2029185 RepID=UPI002CBEE6C9|nr:metallophosphoesterase [Longimicrobium sp.]HSU15965.1 metallophosphoesterase [Longimicrobium sp.]